MDIMRNFAQIGSLTTLVLTSLIVSSYPVAAQNACVVTNSGDVVCGRLQQNSKNPSSGKNQTVEFENIDITLQGCRRNKSTVNCHFLLTTKQDGLGIFYCDYSKMFDFLGKEHFCQQGQLGQTKGGSGSRDTYTRMVKGIPLKAIATFQAVPTQVKEIGAIEVGVGFSKDGSRGYEPENRAVFRSITISE